MNGSHKITLAEGKYVEMKINQNERIYKRERELGFNSFALTSQSLKRGAVAQERAPRKRD